MIPSTDRNSKAIFPGDDGYKADLHFPGGVHTGEEKRDGAHDFQPWLSIASASWLMPSRQYSW